MSDGFSSYGEWWWALPDPAKFETQFCEAVVEGRHILLDDAKNILWPEVFRERCKRKLNQLWENFDASEISVTVSPGAALLEKYALDKATQNGYREISGKSIEEYLIENNVLRNRIIWVNNIPAAQIDQWVECVKRCSPQNTQGGALVIECPKKLAVKSKMKNCVILNYADMIQDYDNYAFCFQLLTDSGNQAPLTVIRYLTSILSRLFPLNVQKTIDVIAENTTALLNFSLDDFERIFGEVEKDVLEHILWQAQLQEIFPIIETGRLHFLKKHKSVLEQLWDKKPNLRKTPYGELSGTDDLEIAGLKYWFKEWNKAYSHKVQKEDVEIVDTLHECRNVLAHLNVCTPTDIKAVLDWEEELSKAKA